MKTPIRFAALAILLGALASLLTLSSQSAAHPEANHAAVKRPSPPAARPAPAHGEADPAAAQIIQQMTDAIGGQRTWDNVPYFRFDFVVVKEGKEMVRFKHWWDKRNGRCRVEGPDDKGRTVTAIFTLKDKKGKSFTDGIVDTDPTNVKNIIEMGYERWVNDTYWIIMPFKLHDPGAHVKHIGVKRTNDGVDYDLLQLSFNQGVGLTPGDRYTLYVNRKTHLIDKWDMALQGDKGTPGSATWEAWTPVGPVKLSLAHRVTGKPVMIRFENVATPATMDETVFTYSRVRS
jgi:hypothetical protein